jgi:uncharacterized protein (DUF3084 family)
MKQPSVKTVAIRTALANKLTPAQVAKEVGVPLGDVMKVVYKDRYTEKKRKARVGKVRSYVRRVPRHPDRTQVVGEHARGMRGSSGTEFHSEMELENRIKMISALQNELDFVRSQFAEAFNKNQDLYNEIKDLQAVIKYLETQVVNLIKSN